MGAERRLPEADELRRKLALGATRADLARAYGVSRQAVSAMVQRERVAPPRISHKGWVPWVVAPQHSFHYLAERLHDLARRELGQPLTDKAVRQLDAWLVKMHELDVVVDYNREDGFHLVRRRPEDGAGYTRQP